MLKAILDKDTNTMKKILRIIHCKEATLFDL